ncbi:ST3 beta-galactoside alpha-2,3-sialyltransferase 3a isoform X2 [Megalobrama amblycephala]|uniref:ST3 beta-galactoside alpha-2,3-sialyltransferase 3a isoform X2 n=1 Tax=Megalobrama amblycephala TaxID=75352 RepID=UPI00201464A2|nr:ST3 beta-galactoside alpha-2,3-sialyltransferase 3a isoform X2 [Megalobrama amblycephala]
MIRMKSTRSFMFLICPMLVLIFLYYSSGRLHLRTSVQKSRMTTWRGKQSFSSFIAHQSFLPEYDKQGFLTKLDRKLPLELQYKYGNLSKGECKPGYTEAKMTLIYPKFSKPAPMFLDPNFKRLSKISSYPPPFGVRTQEKIIDHILSATKSYSLGSELDSLSCKKCIIIGNGGILYNKSLGSKIDQYDVVVRLNEAPVAGFEKDVGSKTTMRITYPEGAIQKPERYEKSSLFVFSAFKAMDFKWLRHMVFKDKLRTMEGFWKSVARVVPRDPEDMRILNPYFIQEAAFKFIGLPHNRGLMGRGNIPTLGTVAITMALHNCDEVAVAGFGYDMNTPHAPLHYYEKLKMSAIKESWTHNISKEKEFLRKLVMGGVIQDLTNGI